ncbi:MAG: SGNH/GDSL hydrolase family protein [Phycisphaerae bacterium]
MVSISVRWKRPALRCLVVTASAVVCLLLAELALRIFWPVQYLAPPKALPGNAWRELLHRRSSIPGLDFELVPNKHKDTWGMVIVTNSHGMRDREPLPDDTESLFRIIVLGDSFTFGYGISGERTYPVVLEDLLNESSKVPPFAYDVLNLGVAGYATRDEAVVLEHVGLRWSPRVVVVGYVLNDPETDPIQSLTAYYHRPAWWQYSHVLRAVAKAKNNWDIARLGRGDYFRHLHAPHCDKWRSVTDAFQHIRQLTESRGIAVLVVIFPIIVDNWEDYPYLDIHQQVLETAKTNGFDCLDLYDAFSQHKPQDLTVSGSDAHPNEHGHYIAAQAIKEKLADGFLHVDSD